MLGTARLRELFHRSLHHLVGPNSVDLHLGFELLELRMPEEIGENTYVNPYSTADRDLFRPVRPHRDVHGPYWILEPNTLYLGCTMESLKAVPGCVGMLHSRSTLARWGVSIHQTAGLGDVGFEGVWTLEITTPHRILLRPGTRCMQISYHPVEGEVTPYAKSTGHHYQGAARVGVPAALEIPRE